MNISLLLLMSIIIHNFLTASRLGYRQYCAKRISRQFKTDFKAIVVHGVRGEHGVILQEVEPSPLRKENFSW